MKFYDIWCNQRKWNVNVLHNRIHIYMQHSNMCYGTLFVRAYTLGCFFCLFFPSSNASFFKRFPLSKQFIQCHVNQPVRNGFWISELWISVSNSILNFRNRTCWQVTMNSWVRDECYRFKYGISLDSAIGGMKYEAL